MHPLSYQTPPIREKYQLTAEEKRWRWRRFVYYGGLALLFLIIAVYFGPNVILFRKLTRLAPDDFVVIVNARYVPVVVAMKQYERDHGVLPSSPQDLMPKYLSGDDISGIIDRGNFQGMAMYNHIITYDFSDPVHPWRVRGPIVKGIIPAAPVMLPSTMPSSKPS